jgi:SSS family solute:Na+ symporter
VLFFGAIHSLIVITSNLGGVDQWWPHEWAPSWQPFSWYDPQERISFLGIWLAVITWQVCTNGSDQMAIQRYLSCASDPAARRAQMTSMAADASAALLLGALGFALFAFFTKNPHLLPGGATLRAGADQLLPRFIVIGLPQGISGLVVAGLLAAAMSSLSSGVNSSSSVITVDFIERFSRNKFTDRAQVRIARIVSVVVGVVVVSLSMLLARSTFGNLFEIAYKVVNFFTAPLFGLFFMAFFVRWATSLGTFAGAAAGLAVCFGINYWEALTDTPRTIGFIWATPLSLISQIIVGCVVSAIERAVRGK